MKIILIVATCKNFTPKCTKFDFAFLGNLQRSPGSPLTALPSSHPHQLGSLWGWGLAAPTLIGATELTTFIYRGVHRLHCTSKCTQTRSFISWARAAGTLWFYSAARLL